MSAELAAAVVDSAGAFRRRKPVHVRPPGSPCPNCNAVLQGPWRHACGQSAEELHRSVVRLAAPVHLFLHMREVYQTSILGTLVRMLLLFMGSVVGFSFLVLGLFWVGLSAMGAG